MRGLKDFILDYWREVFFLLFIGAFLFFFMGYRTKSSEVTKLEKEIKELREVDSNIITPPGNETPAATNDDSQAATTANTPAAIADDRTQYQGFNIKLPAQWSLDESTQSTILDSAKTYVFTGNTGRTIEVGVNPASSSFAADTTWEMLSAVNKDNDNLFDLSVSSASEVLCAQGSQSCTFGDGRLQVGVTDISAAESEANRLFIYFVDTEYIPGGDSYASLKEFIEAIQIDKK